MKQVPRILSIIALAGTFSAGTAMLGMAEAGSIIASTTKRSADRGAVVTVAPATGARTLVGDPTAGTEGLTGLELDGGANLWGTTIDGFMTTSRLLQINPTTGALINDVGFVHTDANDVSGSSLSIGDLAYNPTNGTMYAVTANTSHITGGGDLYTVDTGTGLASFVAQITIDNPDDTDPAFAHDYSTGGLAFRADGSLWFTGYDVTVNPGAGGQNFLFEIDPLTGLELFRVEVSKNDTIFHGLGVRPEDQEFFATEANPGSGGLGGLYHIGIDGTATLVSADTVDGNTLSDVVFIPEPGALAILGAGLIGLFVTRRRRAV